MIELILGGARSGKSRLAESRVTSLAQSKKSARSEKIIYIATAMAHDNEMRERIKHHQQRRSEHWLLFEEPIKLAEILSENNYPGTILLIECLTLWLSNLLCHPEAELFATEKEKFIQALKQSQADIIMVSNETGMGVVPMGKLSRRFVDESGFLHQQLAQISERVTLVIAGLEHTLKKSEDKDD